MTKSPWNNVPDVGIELGAACMPSELASDQATAPNPSYIEIMSQYATTFDLKMNVGHWYLKFKVQWFLPYILKNIWYMNIILCLDYESV